MTIEKYFRDPIVVKSRRVFHEKFPENLYFSISYPREDGSFYITGCFHNFLGDGQLDDYIKFDKNGEIIEVGKI